MVIHCLPLFSGWVANQFSLGMDISLVNWGVMEINLENCGSYDLGKVLNFTGCHEKSLNSV